MKIINVTNLLLVIASTALLGCVTNPPEQYSSPAPTYGQSNSAPTPTYRQSNVSRFGVIDSIDAVRTNNNPSGAGLVVGGLVGGILGHQVGGGNGKTAATVIGAVGGAMVGNNIEQNRNSQSPDHYEIRVRMDNGDRMTVMQDDVADLRIGDRARVVDGRVYRD